MESNKGTGPDMMKMLNMMLPYMDPSTKRMMSIMMKVHELKQLMEPEERVRQEKAAQPQKEEPTASNEAQFRQSKEPAEAHPTMDDMVGSGQNDNLAAQLQEGLTPEQRSMLTSLTGMLN